MPTKVYQNNSFSSGMFSQEFSMQSILDVFVVQGLITHQDAEKLKATYKTNYDIERILLSNHIVTRETINKAYSILLKLPYISLANVKLENDILALIPRNVASKYGVIAFGLKDNNLQLAISQPSELNAEFEKNLQQLMRDKPYDIDLYITGPDDFTEAVKQYGAGGKDAKKFDSNSLPVVFLRNQKLSISLLKRLPLDFIIKHRVVIFYQKNDQTFAMAAEKPESYEVRKSVEYLQKENHIKVQLFATSKEDLDYVIDFYQSQLENEKLLQQKENAQASNAPSEKPDINQEMEEAKKKMAENGQPQNVQPKGDKGSASFTLSGLFSGFKVKDSASPVLTIDSYQKAQLPEAPASNSKVPETDVTPLPEIDSQKRQQETVEAEKLANESNVPVGEPQETPAVTIEDQAGTEPAKKSGDTGEDVEIGSLLQKDIENEQDLKQILSENYIPKVVAAIINYALRLRSSDVHIEAGAKDLRVRYRVDGVLRDIAKLPLSMHPPMVSRVKILAKMKIDETRIPQDGRFDVKFRNREVDVRVSALPTVHGEKIVMRVLDKDQGVLSLEDLGMSGRAFDITVENIAKPYGVILSTGPTGSGKSTTLYAILNRISTPSVNIITLEDPVEYEISGVNQCQIKPAIGFTFAEGLRSVLRQDPNIVMVGEIRDGETASMATHAALTGHLVLSTLHTNDSSGALPRLINMGIEPFLITSSIDEIIAQRLVRRICPKCKEEMKIPQALMDEITRELQAIPANNKRDLARIKPEMKFYHGVGCPDCSHGYKGRVGLFEVLRMTEKIEELAIAKRSANEIKAAAIEDGMITMRQDGVLKCLEGLTTIDEVFRATSG